MSQTDPRLPWPLLEELPPRPVFQPTQRPVRGWTDIVPNALLFAATALSVWAVGSFSGPGGGTRLAIGLLSILFAHEMGHYVACRVHGVDATLPYFIPSPWFPAGGMGLWAPLSMVGTFGALIRIRGPIPHRRALFDIGVAGPLAGFAVCLPVLVLGVVESGLQPLDAGDGGIYLGEPLLMRWASHALVGPAPDGMTRVLGPLGLAAWFGLLVTALNLIPVGQLDGGHVTYALLHRRAAAISRWGSWACLALTWFGPNWIVWWALLRFLGRRHPPTLDDREEVGPARVWVGAAALVVFALCFVPDPIVWSWSDFFDAIR